MNGAKETILTFIAEDEYLEMKSIKINIPLEFPYTSLKKLAQSLEDEEVFVPGYVPPLMGLYNPDNFIYESTLGQVETILLPDRNIITRIVQISKGFTVDPMMKKAAAIKVFWQLLDIQIEPSIAFHELAHAQGNKEANEELAWFRSADDADYSPWLDLSSGAIDRIKPLTPEYPIETYDLAHPLKRWRRNYIAALKIAQIELRGGKNIDKLRYLLDWMRDDFMVAGPAIILACIYFAPRSAPRSGLFKSLRSINREKALSGVKNAAWDLTHLSDLVQKTNDLSGGRYRILFASFDTGLRMLAKLIFMSYSEQLTPKNLTDAIMPWWPVEQAVEIGEEVCKLIAYASGDERRYRQSQSVLSIDEMIAMGEEKIYSFEGLAK